MKTKRIKKVISVLLMSVLSLFLVGTFVGCNNTKSGKQFVTYSYFNTTSTLVIYSNFYSKKNQKKVEETWTNVKESLAKIESKIAVDIEGSDVWNFNASNGGEIEIDKITYELLSIAKEMYDFTEGAYNPAMGIYVDLWGFSPRFSSEEYTATMPYDREDWKKNLPSQAYLDAFTSLVDFSAVIIEEKEGRYFVTKPDNKVTVAGTDYTMQINLGGIGKGYATDKAYDFLTEEGYKDGYFSVGRSSLRLMNNPIEIKASPIANAWKVALINPFDSENTYADVFCKQTSVSTSGDYENYYENNSKRYCHIIDTSTFAPIDNGVSSVSVVGPLSSYCDALSTALCVMGKEKAFAFGNEKLSDYALTLVTLENGEKVVYTKDKSSTIFVQDQSFVKKEWGEI